MDQTCSLGGMKVRESQPFWREQTGTRVIHSYENHETHLTDSYRFIQIHTDSQLAHLPLISIFLSSVPSLLGITGDRGMQDTLDSVCESNALEKKTFLPFLPMHPPAKDKLNYQFRTCAAQGGGTKDSKNQLFLIADEAPSEIDAGFYTSFFGNAMLEVLLHHAFRKIN